MKRYQKSGFVEIIGPYRVGYTAIYSVRRKRDVWVWGATMIEGRSPLIPVPDRVRGEATDTLPEARNQARERLPSMGGAKIAGIDHTQVTEM